MSEGVADRWVQQICKTYHEARGGSSMACNATEVWYPRWTSMSAFAEPEWSRARTAVTVWEMHGPRTGLVERQSRSES